MKYKNYLIVGRTLREAVYCFNYMSDLLRDHIVRASKSSMTTFIDEYCLHFISGEQYFRYGRVGYRGEVLNARYVERLLDTYATLKGAK